MSPQHESCHLKKKIYIYIYIYNKFNPSSYNISSEQTVNKRSPSSLKIYSKHKHQIKEHTKINFLNKSSPFQVSHLTQLLQKNLPFYKSNHTKSITHIVNTKSITLIIKNNPKIFDNQQYPKIYSTKLNMCLHIHQMLIIAFKLETTWTD